MSDHEEKRRLWQFTIPEGGFWGWNVTHPDGSRAAAVGDFLTLRECVDDAKKHGYIYGIRRGRLPDYLRGTNYAATSETETPEAQRIIGKTSQLLQDLVSCDAGDAKQIQQLQQDARTILAVM